MTEERDQNLPPEDVLRQIRDGNNEERRRFGERRTGFGYLGQEIDSQLWKLNTLSDEELLERQEEFWLTIAFAQAFTEGLPGLRFNLDLNPKPESDAPQDVESARVRKEQAEAHVAFLERYFLSREGSRERLWSQIANTLDEITFGRRTLLDLLETTRTKTEREVLDPERIVRIDGLLMEAALFIRARRLIDEVFKQRQLLSEDADSTRESMRRGKDVEWRTLEFPDRVDWEKLLGGEFGKKVDAGLREIVKMAEEGVKDEKGTVVLKDPYATGFVKKEDFALWLKNIYKACGERMDAAAIAWKLALIWEIPSKYGIAVVAKREKVKNSKEEKFKGWELKIGDPPIVADWFVSTALLNYKRILEGGWFLPSDNSNLTKEEVLEQMLDLKKLGRAQPEVYYNKVGSPLSIGKIGSLYDCYLDHARVKVKEKNGVEGQKTFWELWQGGVKLGQLPWREVEAVVAGTEEPAPLYSFQYWALIKRGRAMGMAAMITEIHESRDMVDFGFWKGLARNWNKLGLPRNGRKWVVLSWLYPYRESGYEKKDSEFSKQVGLGSPVAADWGTFRDLKNTEQRGFNFEIVLAHARRADFLDAREVDWVKNALKEASYNVVKILDRT